ALALTVLGLLFVCSVSSKPALGANSETATASPQPRGDNSSPAAQNATSSVRLRDGDTLGRVFARIGLSPADSRSALEALKSKLDVDGVQAGLDITVTHDSSGVAAMRFSPDLKRTIVLRRSTKGGFTAFALPRALTHHAVRVAGRIDSS